MDQTWILPVDTYPLGYELRLEILYSVFSFFENAYGLYLSYKYKQKKMSKKY